MQRLSEAQAMADALAMGYLPCDLAADGCRCGRAGEEMQGMAHRNFEALVAGQGRTRISEDAAWLEIEGARNANARHAFSAAKMREAGFGY